MASVANKLAVKLASKLAVGMAQGIGFDPLSLFAAGEQGWWHDSRDLASFYADDAMTTPATVNGTVGAWRDKSGRGNHRKQTTAASRRTLRGTPLGDNLFVNYGTPETGWVNSGAGVATATATTGNMPTGITLTTGRSYLIRWTATVSGGTVRMVGGGVTGATRTASGTTEAYFDAVSTAELVVDGVTSFTGTVSAIDVRDVTADVVTAPYGLQGPDDNEVMSAIDLTGTDKLTVCVGVRKLSDAATGVVMESSANAGTTAGAFYIVAPLSAGNAEYAFNARGASAAAAYRATTFTAPVSNVLFCAFDLAAASGPANVVPRVNGATPTLTQVSAGPCGGGAFGNHAVYTGRRNGATLPFTGVDYGGIGVGRAVTATERANIQRLIDQCTPGVAL